MGMLADMAGEIRKDWSMGHNWSDEYWIRVNLYERIVNMPFEEIEEHYQEDKTDE